MIVKNIEDDGQCLLEAYTEPAQDDLELGALAEETGLSVDRLRDFESPITEDDAAAAPPEGTFSRPAVFLPLFLILTVIASFAPPAAVAAAGGRA